MHDYKPGDERVPVGTVVNYFGSRRHGRYWIARHMEPQRPAGYTGPLDGPFPDGTAYVLIPEGLPDKMDVPSVINIRRTSFAVESRS
jgi:hypothetical protein